MNPAESTSSRPGLVLLAAFLGWMFDGLEMGLFPLVASPALGQMQATAGLAADKAFIGHWMGIITACFLVGAACGGLVFGWLGDRIGRVRALSASILTYSVFTGLVYFAQTPAQLGILRFVAALGMGGEWSLGVALVMEVWPERLRPWLAGWIGAAGNLGFLASGLLGLTYPVTGSNWRWIMVAGTAPALLTFFIRQWVPESERWLHATQAAPARPIREIFSPPLLKLTVLASLLSGVVLIGTWGSVQWLPLWADQMAGGSDHRAKAWTQIVSALGAVPAGLVGAWLAQKCGRRAAYALLCVGSLVSCAAMFREMDAFGPFFLTMTFLVGGVTAAFFGWLPLYLPEIFPTRVRATAQGFAYNAGRILAAFGALQMGALTGYFGGYAKAGAVVTLIYAVGFVLIWFAPESRGKPLPE
jgi:MFS family permease